MFRERYYKSFPVRVKIIAYDAIIIFCHLVEVAIFAVCDFLSLFSIAVFNIPISHIIVVLLFLLQRYNLFPYLQFFFNFFLLIVCRSPYNRKIYFVLLPFPVVVCSGRVPVVCRSCVLFPSIIHAYIHAYTYTRARGFLDSNF